MNRVPYTYSILRYCHDPLSGEQVNVGVAIYAPKSQFAGFRVRRAIGRLSKLFPDLDSSNLRNDLARIERAFSTIQQNQSTPFLFTEEIDVMRVAQKVVPIDDGTLIWSEMGSGVSKDVEKTLDDLYLRFVGQYDKSEAHKRPDADVWRPFRDRLLERNIAHIFDRKTIASSRVKVEFEHAWKNGVWHCFQPLSFDLSSPDGIQDKAARWVGQLVGLSKADERFETYLIVGEPTEESMLPAYDRAVAFLRDATTAHIVLEKNVGELADEIEDKVHHSQAAR